ncbi:lipocalin family protein [Muricauda sp. SCSIO 64092]|uniref:lipocalin family protein n=1 Tax=Allomuricauda sp. SCSIO 64092 TaxID=2908842 RepID=UPI001FF45757|nr:lipocalin family protein [Muricauda sp. SCSIO 64092]UOY06550.1 lipocalin family protein [Muricauda sp. SCSIO 64092]
MKLKKCFYYVILVLTIGCSKDDENNIDQGNIDNFYSGADRSASINQLEGIWAIFSAEFDGERTEVPITYAECERDFFIYSENGTYREYLFQSSGCDPQINELDWELNNGVLTFTNSLGQSDDLVIIRLNDQEFVFKSRFDVDEDGQLDVLILTAKKYEPEEIDFVSSTFKKNTDDAFENLINFTWEEYNGFNSFERYEVYRSAGENCSKANSELIATITDVTENEYTDLSPPAVESLCYYLRVYTDKGILGESNVYDITPSFFIRMSAVSQKDPVVTDNSIEISWEPSDSPYFSHYEITVSNYGGTSANGAQEYTLAEITDIDETNYIDKTPPYLENPFYTVYAYNIFGNKSPLSDNQNIGVREVNFKRKEVIEYKSILSLTVDPEAPIVYLFGKPSGNGNTGIDIRRYNYERQETEAVSDISPQSSTYSDIKLFLSQANGKELVIKQGIELYFYNADTMEFKYAIVPEGVSGFWDFTYAPELDLWLFITGSEIFTLKRDNTNLSLIDSTPHFTQHQGNTLHRLFMLNNNRVLVGHPNEPNSIVKSLDQNGFIVGSEMVDFGIRGFNNEKTLHNTNAMYMLDTEENRLYSTDTFQVIESFEFPAFPSGTSIDGTQVFGSNNDRDWQVNSESPHQKEAVVYGRNLGQANNILTIGYPHFIFEDYNGNIISVSTGFKKQTLNQNYNDKADIFVERLDTP